MVSRRTWTRLAVLAVILVALFAVGEITGVRKGLSVARLRELTAGAGLLGVLAFVVAFAVGELVQIPGLVFVAAGIAAWGPVRGGALAWAAAVLSVVVTFVVVRGVGGKALSEVDNPWMKRALTHLDARPIVIIVMLRTVFVISPPLNYALALSTIRLRDYLIGSALGLMLPIVFAAIFFEQIIRRL